MKKKVKREVQKELKKILENQKLSASPSSSLQEIYLPSSNDDASARNFKTQSEASLKRKRNLEPEDSDSESSSDDDEDSDTESSDDDSETYKSKRMRKNKKCTCAKNFKYFKFQFKKLAKTQNVILTELLNFRNEMLINSSVKNEHDYSSALDTVEDNFEILGLPCQTVESFIEFEKQCNESKEAEHCLRELFRRIDENDMTKYIRICMKRLLVDDIAIKFTWYGFHNNVAVKGFVIIRILKDACLVKFASSTEDDVLSNIKKWFHYAKDRFKKLEKRQIS